MDVDVLAVLDSLAPAPSTQGAAQGARAATALHGAARWGAIDIALPLSLDLLSAACLPSARLHGLAARM